MMMEKTALLVIFVLFSAGCCLYLDESDPWQDGPLQTASLRFTRNETTIPMGTNVFYPIDAGDALAVLYFIGGFDGVIPAEMYDGILTSMATHGYIVAGTWPVAGEDGYNSSHWAHLSNLDWLRENMADNIEAVPSWDHLSYSCHSAGCGTTYRMTAHDITAVSSNVFLEPSSGEIHIGENCTKPAIMLGALLAVGDCVGPSDHVTFYNYWECPRLLLEAEEFGHCDLLDQPVWEVCDATNYCDTGPEDRIDEYRAFVQGMSSAFMNAYVQGSMHYLDYLLVEENIPVNLSIHETDVEC